MLITYSKLDNLGTWVTTQFKVSFLILTIFQISTKQLLHVAEAKNQKYPLWQAISLSLWGDLLAEEERKPSKLNHAQLEFDTFEITKLTLYIYINNIWTFRY